jgi:hypothetical protein
MYKLGLVDIDLRGRLVHSEVLAFSSFHADERAMQGLDRG